jgi:hypothetical protein
MKLFRHIAIHAAGSARYSKAAARILHSRSKPERSLARQDGDALRVLP